jgi:hypothetical protein
MEMMNKIQRAILENQIILAEALWTLLHSQGTSSDAMLQNVSARITDWPVGQINSVLQNTCQAPK